MIIGESKNRKIENEDKKFPEKKVLRICALTVLIFYLIPFFCIFLFFIHHREKIQQSKTKSLQKYLMDFKGNVGNIDSKENRSRK